MRSPALLHANYYQFTSGQRMENPCVGSRALLWCRAGMGEVEVDGSVRVLTADNWILLPWRHRIVYRADRRHPFFLAGIHVCPDHSPGTVTMLVPHHVDDPLSGTPLRRDAAWSGLTGLVSGVFATCPRLRDLGEWIVARWVAETPDSDQSRAMALLLVDELRRTAAQPAPGALPPMLAEAVRAAESSIGRPLSLDSLARTAGCSVPTLVRLFRRHLHCAPMAWLRQRRIAEAQRLLAGGGIPVSEVGARIGIPDPRRFAKAFRMAVGVTPREWRGRQRF